MNKVFVLKFQTDEKGLPKRWGSNDDIPKQFTSAKKQAYNVLDLFAIVRLSPELDEVSVLDKFPKVDESLVVVNSDECLQIRQQFDSQADVQYHTAFKDQENARFYLIGIPLFVMVFLSFVFLDRLSSVILFLTIGAAICAIFVLGLAPVILPKLEAGVLLARQHVNNALLLAQAHQNQAPPPVETVKF